MTVTERAESAGMAMAAMATRAAVLALGAVLALAGPLQAGESAQQQDAAALKLSATERTVPTFSLAGFDGRDWTHTSLEGRVWLVNFWATWCPPCVEEIPGMNTVYRELSDQGLGMLAINAGEDDDTVGAFLKKTPIDFPVVRSDALKTLSDWEVKGLPTTLVIDSQGRVLYEAIGPREWDDPAMIAFIRSLAHGGE